MPGRAQHFGVLFKSPGNEAICLSVDPRMSAIGREPTISRLAALSALPPIMDI